MDKVNQSVLQEARVVPNMSFSKTSIQYTDVVIIGNGPSGITLSYMLAGNWPYYKGTSHPNEYLHMRLQNDAKKSLVEQDLDYLSSGLEGRSSNPVALLFDAVTHPDADMGLDTGSLLHWDHQESKVIPHTVLGRTKQGGAWQMIEGDVQTLSLGGWMELPGMPFKQWVEKQRVSNSTGSDITNVRPDRASIREVRQYYENYVKCMQLEQFFRNKTVVTSVEKVLDISHSIDLESGEQNPCSKDHCGRQKWEVRGYEVTTEGDSTEICTEFCYRADNVVLATGTYDVPNRLKVPGESFPYILQSLSDLEQKIFNGELGVDSDPLVIVGAGLTAADLILTAIAHRIPIVHVFRKEPEDPGLIFKKLPKMLYPEYHKVHQMMAGKGEVFERYESYPSHRILEFKQDNKVLIRRPDSCESIIQASFVVIAIGSRPDLSFLPQEGRSLGTVPDLPIDSKHNPIDINPFSHQSNHEPGLFAMGPLVGDNFVRFLRGGALAITSHLWQKKECLL